MKIHSRIASSTHRLNRLQWYAIKHNFLAIGGRLDRREIENRN